MLTRLGVNGLKTLTSKNARCLVPQKSTATTSSLAPSSRLEDFNRRCSFESGWSAGSIPTPMQTSSNNSAVRSLISLCLLIGNPPQLQLSACSTEKDLPQTQLLGRCCGLQPYLRQSASRKSPLCRANPYSASGNTVSQLEAPFSLDKAIDRCKSWLPFSDNSCTALFSLLFFQLWLPFWLW